MGCTGRTLTFCSEPAMIPQQLACLADLSLRKWWKKLLGGSVDKGHWWFQVSGCEKTMRSRTNDQSPTSLHVLIANKEDLHKSRSL